LQDDLTSALTNLGYKKTEAKSLAVKVLSNPNINSIASAIKEVMKVE
jgi:Holliday junction resolvasome RuvABC DNA-binding subunit